MNNPKTNKHIESVKGKTEILKYEYELLLSAEARLVLNTIGRLFLGAALGGFLGMLLGLLVSGMEEETLIKESLRGQTEANVNDSRI